MTEPTKKFDKFRRRRIITLSISVVLLAVAAFLINRFLIVHEDVPAYLLEKNEDVLTPAPLPTPEPTPAPTALSASVPGETPKPTPEPTPEPTPFADDWNYVSKNLEIHIEQVKEGRHVLYVADILLRNGTQFHTAFANGKYGRNIRQTATAMADENGALFAINGDYYGFRDNGIIIREGLLYRDNAARDMMALYTDGSMKILKEKDVSAEQLVKDGVFNSLSFGPALVVDGEIVSEETLQKSGVRGSNPRTGIGMIEPNHYIVIVADGRSDYSSGITLDYFAQSFLDRGCMQAYNLDGGGSSTMVFRGRLVNKPQGSTHQRSTSDILYLKDDASAAPEGLQAAGN